MKLYNAAAPNPKRVRIFLMEKGIDLPKVEVDVAAGEARTKDFLGINSLGETPVFETDDGTIICESVAICRYLEALYPAPALFGGDPLEQAKVEMWNRRVELHLMRCVADFVQHTIPFFADKVEQNADYAAAQRRALCEKWVWLDSELADGREYLAGTSFSVADITGMATLVICDFQDLSIPAELEHARRWETAMRERASFSA